MHNSEPQSRYRGMVYSYSKDRQKLKFAYFLLSTGFGIFLLTLIGAMDGVSEWIDYFLLDNLGYTNKWSKTYGSSLFVHTLKDLSALGGKVLLFIATTFTVVYYTIRKEKKLLWKFLMVISGGSFLLLVIKMVFAEDVPYEPIDLLVSSVATYPSGHAFMAMLFYLTIAVFLTRKQRRSEVKVYTFVFTSIIIFLIGLSRILGAQHNLTEVLAGWSLAIIWLSCCWLLERFIKINYKWDI
ncbi:MAG: phosphatase PAP2 family protein [Ignavibacteriaceae bacterium]|jgi:undecaprenyl-diphosphatase